MYKKLSPIPRFIAIFWTAAFSVILLGVVFFWSISAGLFGPLPAIEELENPTTNLASEIISEDGKTIGKFYIENRSNVHYSDLSPHLVNALIATEDFRFRSHAGIDLKGLARVFIKTFILRQNDGGGSTITQQLAKNLFTNVKAKSLLQRVKQKFKEWVIATRLEKRYTKEEILAMYLNTVQFNGNSFGIKSASNSFFNKTPKELDIKESAVLVALLKAITQYNPSSNPENSFKRRNVVMYQMVKYNYLEKTVYDSLKVTPTELDYRDEDHNEGLATHFREYLRQFLNAPFPEEENYREKRQYDIDIYFWENNPFFGFINKNLKPDGTKYNLYKDGLRIYVTLNSIMQKYAEDAMHKQMTDLQSDFFKHWKGREPWGNDKMFLVNAMKQTDRWRKMKTDGYSEEDILKAFDVKHKMKIYTYKGTKDTVMSGKDSVKYYKMMAHAGFISIQPSTGAVRAWVGGNEHRYFKYDHVNIHATRQVGSTFKPFVYTRYVDEKKDICMKVPDQPVTFLLEDGNTWTPKNSDAKNGNEVPLWKALALSKNNCTAHIMKSFGDKPWLNVVQQAQAMGVRNILKSDEVPALCLGIATLSLYEMVGAYSSFGNKGVYVEPYFVGKIEDKNGVKISPDYLPPSKDAMSEKTAFLMMKMMERVTSGGTASKLRYTYKIDYSIPIAGKTGTTQNNSDGWFIGITPDLASGAWVGWEDMQVHFRTTQMGSGGAMAMPIFAYYMKKIYEDEKINLSKKGVEVPKDRESMIFDCNSETYNEDENNTNPNNSGTDWGNL